MAQSTLFYNMNTIEQIYSPTIYILQCVHTAHVTELKFTPIECSHNCGKAPGLRPLFQVTSAFIATK